MKASSENEKYYRGHHVEGQWVFGGREKYNKRKIFMIPVPNRKEKNLDTTNKEVDKAWDNNS